MLKPYRRHLDCCPHKAKGRAYTRCSCPVHVDGFVGDVRVRQSLETVNWEAARRRLLHLEAEIERGISRKPVRAVADLFLAGRSVEAATKAKYVKILNFLCEFAGSSGLTHVGAFTLEHLDAYRAGRPLNALSWSKELEILRRFFDFAEKRGYAERNPAREMDMPRNVKPRPRQPYTREEMAAILAAAETVEDREDRLRVRALLLLLRYYGFRISDAALFRKERIEGDLVFLHALKNGAALRLPLEPEVKFALDVLPPPKGAAGACAYYFWSGEGSRYLHVKAMQRLLRPVFLASQVQGACPHRFRHTLATEILAVGGTMEDAANILGDSPETIRRHYARWSSDYQRRTETLFGRVHGRATNRPNRAAAADVGLGGRGSTTVRHEPDSTTGEVQ